MHNWTDIYKGKKALVTGHTGFKGSWLSQWLLQLGAKPYGYALEPPTQPALFEQLELDKHMNHYIGDVRNLPQLRDYIKSVDPDIIFHLAAQPLVRDSYKNPLETIETNTMGVVYLMEAVRTLGIAAAVVVVTTDKCYKNNEWLYGYRENEPMGGYDPYSSSKGAAELLIDSYRNSFFNPSRIDKHGVRLSSARAGNVIGGGDWAKDRIVPDCIRFLAEGQPIQVRNPHATRPWQHVLEPLGGYLKLGARLLEGPEQSRYCEAFNFGPNMGSNKNVRDLVETILTYWGGGSWNDASDQTSPHEASLLHLSIDKAYHKLGWLPVWDFNETIEETVKWYKQVLDNKDAVSDITAEQIKKYQERLISDTPK